MPILIFHDWDKPFHVHVDASSIALWSVLTELGEVKFEHLIAFARHKLSNIEKNYTTEEKEGHAMIYTL